MDTKKPVFRGEVYYADLSPSVGSEQCGLRPVIIVQNDMGNKHSPATIIIPITSRLTKHQLPVHVNIGEGIAGLPSDSIALCEQVRTISKLRLSDKLGELPSSLMSIIDRALKISLSLN